MTRRATRGWWRERFGTEHHEFELNREAAADIISEAGLASMTSPTPTPPPCRPIILPNDPRYVTVALNGDAGDENFGGYRRYSMSLLVNYLRHAPLSLRRLAAKHSPAATLCSVRTVASPAGSNSLTEIIGVDWRTAYGRMLALFDDAEKRELYSGDFAAQELPPSMG